MHPGRPTLGDVARVAGVHKATASRALNPATVHRVHAETAERVRAAAERLGYRPNMNARGLRAGSTQSVGLLVPDILNPLYPPFIRGAEVCLADAGYFTLVANSELDPAREATAIDSMMSRQVDGLIAGVSAAGLELCAEVAARGLPVVTLSPPPGRPGLGTVECDFPGGIDQIVDLVVSLGHEHVGHVAAPASYVDPLVRQQLILDTLDRRRPGHPPVTVDAAETLSIDAGQAAAARLLARDPDVTAIIAYNDLLAVGALRAVAAAGLECPDDVTVIGFNDVPLVGELTPALTTVLNDTRAQGDAAAEILLAMFEGAPPLTHRRVATRLVLRGSHGPAKPRR